TNPVSSGTRRSPAWDIGCAASMSCCCLPPGATLPFLPPKMYQRRLFASGGESTPASPRPPTSSLRGCSRIYPSLSCSPAKHGRDGTRGATKRVSSPRFQPPSTSRIAELKQDHNQHACFGRLRWLHWLRLLRRGGSTL